MRGRLKQPSYLHGYLRYLTIGIILLAVGTLPSVVRPAEVKDYSPPMGPYPGEIDIPGFQHESEAGKGITILKIEAKDLPIVKLGDSSAVHFNFLVPINTVKEFIARAGIQTGKESAFNELWTQALVAYQKQDCGTAMKYCDAVLKLMPGQPDAVKLQRLTQEKITRGECPPSWKKIALYIGIGVGILVILLLIILFVRKGSQRKIPAASEASSAELSGDVTHVRSSEPPVAPLGILIGKEGPLEGEAFEISKEGLKIGRDPTRCDIVIDNPHVSREHAWVGEENGKLVVKDLTSANGTFLNTLSHQITTESLTPGDIIIIGKGRMARFLFKRPQNTRNV